MIEHKTEHELNVMNSFETALIDQHNMSHNDLLHQSELLNELPHQHQPVIVRPNSTKLPRMLLDNDGKYYSSLYYFKKFSLFLLTFYVDKILDNVITENDKLNVQKLEHEFSQITNYDVFLNQPTVALTRIDISEHGIYNLFKQLI